MNTVFLCLSYFFIITSVECFLEHSARLPVGGDPGKAIFLTQLIEEGKIIEALHLSRVQPDLGNITSYSGYLTTNKECGNNLFFWFFPAIEDWKSAPVVLWLEGGPGVSSMYGLFQEVGPFNSFPEGLQNRNHSWNVKNNLLFIDQPVGTGYSFTEKRCFARNVSAIGEDLYSALIQFLKLFPDLQNNKLFLSGEFLAGHFIPTIGYVIHKNNLLANLKINLKGMLIGGGWFDAVLQINYADYLYQVGSIDRRQQQKLYYFQNLLLNQVSLRNWKGAYKTWTNILVLIGNFTGNSIYNYLSQSTDKSNWDEFVQLTSTRRSIHVGSKVFISQSHVAALHLAEDMMRSVKPLVEFLLENDYPIVVYVGQMDIVCGYPMAVEFLRALDWSGQQLYLGASRSKWVEDGEVVGYVKGERLLYDVLVRDAGHTVARDQPLWMYQLVNAFTSTQNVSKDALLYLVPPI